VKFLDLAVGSSAGGIAGQAALAGFEERLGLRVRDKTA
jgi:hypothetical protein